jgi:hypothetical protein
MQNRIAFDAHICSTLKFGLDFALKQMSSYIALTRGGEESLPYIIVSPHPQIPLHAALITPVTREDYNIVLPSQQCRDIAVGLNEDVCPELRFNLKSKGDTWREDKITLFRFFLTNLEGRFRNPQNQNVEYPNYVGLSSLRQFVQDETLILKQESPNKIRSPVQNPTQAPIQNQEQKIRRRKKADERQEFLL